MVFLCAPRPMVWNEEEDQKSHLFGDFLILIEPLTLEAHSAAAGSRKQETRY